MLEMALRASFRFRFVRFLGCWLRPRFCVTDDKMTMDGSKSEPGKNGATQQECAGCGKAITER